MTQYHAHITTLNKDIQLRGWKPTRIILMKGADCQQEDLMLTKYYVLGKNNIFTIEDIMVDLRKADKEVSGIRVKLEQTSNFNRPITKEEYFEVHIKVCGKVTFSKEWVRSRNPREVTENGEIYFYNKRYYYGSFEGIFQEVGEMLWDCGESILEVKYEQVVWDSNHSLDKWWA